MVEWSITTVLKTVVLRGTGGSNPSLSANKGVNQQVMRFTPFITPKNAIVVLLCRIHYLHNQKRTRADIKLSRGSLIENI